jgi:hypothetical protein
MILLRISRFIFAIALLDLDHLFSDIEDSDAIKLVADDFQRHPLLLPYIGHML